MSRIVHKFTRTVPQWQPRVTPVDLQDATEEQLDALSVTPSNTVGWMNSPGHCANLMNPGFTDIGVACVKGGSGNTYGTYWTMDLGTPR